MSGQKTCLVIGAGAGIGGTVGKRFAEGGYHAALCRRSDVDGLNGMVEDFKAAGLSASGHLLNAVDDGALENVIEEVEACLLYTSPSPRDRTRSRMPSSA